MDLTISDFTVTFDLDCQSLDYNTPSVMMLTFSYADYEVSINRNHFGKEIEPVVKFIKTGTFTVRSFPDNAYTQIIAAELNPVYQVPQRKTDANNKVVSAIAEWKGIILTLYDKAVKEIDFPELCYYCP